MNRKFCYALLTCDESEKEAIAKALLEKHLIVCAKFVPVGAMYWWQGSIENANEIAILMETSEDMFDEIEAELTKIHSYNTFVLTAIPMVRISNDAEKWMNENLS